MALQKQFCHDLIVGRIAETVCELMFRELDEYMIFHSGYESAFTLLAQYQHEVRRRDVVDQVRHLPDLLLIKNDKKQAYFIEVKYRSVLKQEEVLEIAEGQLKSWPLSHLLIATPDGFFYDPVQTIVHKKGVMHPLEERIVPLEKQQKYLSLLREFLL